MTKIGDVPPIYEEQHRRLVMMLFHTVRSFIAPAVERDFKTTLENFFDDKDMVITTKQRMQQLEEREKLALPALNLLGDLVIGKGKDK